MNALGALLRNRWLLGGVALALAASVVTWAVAQTVLGSLAGWGEKLSAVVGLVAIGVLLLSFPITYYAAAGSIRNLFFRYAIPMVPFLCLAAARLVCQLSRTIVVQAFRPAVSGGPERSALRPMYAAVTAAVPSI